MTGSAQLRISDLRALLELVHECRDLGDDANAWRVHFGEKIGAMIGADLAIVLEAEGCTSPQPRDLGVAEWGWDNGFERKGWIAALEEFHRNPHYSISLNRYFGRLAKQDGVVHSRREMIADREWEPTFERNCIHVVCGFDETSYCFRSIPGGDFAGVMVFRAIGERAFGPREHAVLAEAQRSIAPLVGGPLARFRDPLPSELRPRERQVLKCFLEGDSDKQVAMRLGLSVYTVNEYAKKIYEHFGARSRSELLARWVRRGWSNRAAWAD